MRIEKDSIGKLEIPKNAFYGINSLRAKNNFSYHVGFSEEWYKAVATVKLSCYLTYKQFKKSAQEKYNINKFSFSFISDEIIEALIFSATEISQGKHFDNFIVSAIQGGAGTSINMNINEIITNNALTNIDKKLGDYNTINPIQHANIYQSTNDVIPTALKIAIIKKLNHLDDKINETRAELEKLEKQYRDVLRIGYTQLQEAVPSSYGILFASYSEAFSRDWWRVSKCFERIKTVNLGGSAIGTGITIPRYFIMEVVQQLQKLTNLPITRSENMPDATSNLDPFVEIHSIIKSHAVNIQKIASDLRLLSSDIHKNKSLTIPSFQTGSSIMPGKINPVINEYLIGICSIIYKNDALITDLCSKGDLELNAFLPLIGHYILESIDLLINANETLKNKLLTSIIINEKISTNELVFSPAIATILIPYIGYNKAEEIAIYMKEKSCNIIEANNHFNYIDKNKINNLLKPGELLKTGFSLNDI